MQLDFRSGSERAGESNLNQTASAPHRSTRSDIAPDRRSHSGDNLALLSIAAALVLIHLLTNSRYGFHRDELQFLSDARHLDWGFVAFPPFTAVRRAHQPGALRPFPGGLAPVFGAGAGAGHCRHRANGAGTRRQSRWRRSLRRWPLRSRRCRSLKAPSSSTPPSISCGGC